MDDVVVISAADRESVAARLREALAEQGYSVARGSPAGAKAVVVLWSKSAAAVPAMHTLVEDARRHGTLIPASADGVKPPLSIDEELKVALVSGWRGEPTHPGWQKVLAEVRDRCGVPEPVAAAPSVSDGPAPAKPQPQAPGKPRPLLWLTLAAAILAIGAFAAVLALRPDRTAPDQVAISPAAPPPVQAPPAPPGPDLSVSELPEEGALKPIAPPAVDEQPETGVATPKATAPKGPPRRQAARPVYRNSRNMQLFCERAGRNTAECRRFRAAMPRSRATVSREVPAKVKRAAEMRPARYRYSRNMRLFCEGAGRRTKECREFVRRGGAR